MCCKRRGERQAAPPDMHNDNSNDQKISCKLLHDPSKESQVSTKWQAKDITANPNIETGSQGRLNFLCNQQSNGDCMDGVVAPNLGPANAKEHNMFELLSFLFGSPSSQLTILIARAKDRRNSWKRRWSCPPGFLQRRSMNSIEWHCWLIA